MKSAEFKLKGVPEWLGHDPFGRPRKEDVSGNRAGITASDGTVLLTGARNSYVSFRLVVRGRGSYRVSADIPGGLETDIFRAWYHRVTSGRKTLYIPDALIPVSKNETLRLPDPDNRIKGQKVQEFWIDIFIPGSTRPGDVSGTVKVESGKNEYEISVRISVLKHRVPAKTTFQMDHNSYGYTAVDKYYPKSFSGIKSRRGTDTNRIRLLHHYYRIFHEHRGMFHNLGYMHSGEVGRIYRPDVRGKGRSLELVNWQMYDRHFGPLFEGTVFKKPSPGMPGPRRPADPIWGVYAPFNPEWPADYINWKEKGYDVEYTRGIKQFDSHLKKKKWTRSYIEYFFNHKKRYRWFEWDGDEPKYEKDFEPIGKMGDLLHPAVKGSPVKWTYRADVSWHEKKQWEVHKDNINFYVNAGLIRWYRKEAEKTMSRKNTIMWRYGGLPSVTGPSSMILQNLFTVWSMGMTGFLPWSSIDVGDDPWFDFDGGSGGCVYPGERFGIEGPLPSIRLKIERNGMQDIDLINTRCRNKTQHARLRNRLIARLPISTWGKMPKGIRKLPPEDWDSRNMHADHEPGAVETRSLDPAWWSHIRKIAFGKEVR